MQIFLLYIQGGWSWGPTSGRVTSPPVYLFITNFIFKPSFFVLLLWCLMSSIIYLEKATPRSNTAWKWLQIFAKSPFLCFWEFQPFLTSGFTGTPLSLFGRWFLSQFFDLCQLMGYHFYSTEWDWSLLEKLTSLWWPTEGCVAASPFR